MTRILLAAICCLLLLAIPWSAGWADESPPGSEPEPEPAEPDPQPEPPEPGPPEPEPPAPEPDPEPEPTPPEPPEPEPEPTPPGPPEPEPQPQPVPAPSTSEISDTTRASEPTPATAAPAPATPSRDAPESEAVLPTLPECPNCPLERDLLPYWSIGLGASSFSGVGFLIRHHPNEKVAVQFTGGVVSTTGEQSSTLYAAGFEVQGTIRRTMRSRVYVTGGLGTYGEYRTWSEEWRNEDEERRTSSIAAGIGLGGELSLGFRSIRDNVSLGLSFHPIEYRTYIERTSSSGDHQIGPGAALWVTYNF